MLPVLAMDDQVNRRNGHAVFIGQVLLRLPVRPALSNLEYRTRSQSRIRRALTSRVPTQPLDRSIPADRAHTAPEVWSGDRAARLTCGELDRPLVPRSFRPMQATMLAAAHHLQILSAVIVSLMIDVVDKFGGGKRATKHFRRHNAVFPDITPNSVGMIGSEQLHVTAPHCAWLRRVLSGFVRHCLGAFCPCLVRESDRRTAVATAPMCAVGMAARIIDRIEVIGGEIAETFPAASGRLGVHDGSYPLCHSPAVYKTARGFIMPNYSIFGMGRR